ncbi:hypothetical protein B4U84_05280 [Westiellopsis prolifica IICB1]|nr:hypothetical protein B4U84_05280 [Westiellopsis prolifica IICB1]
MIGTINWLTSQIQKLWIELSSLWTTKLFILGNKEVSLKFILELIFSLIIAFLIARLIKELIKRLFLARFVQERGSLEALSALLSYTLTILAFLVVLQTVGISLSSLTIFAGAIGIGFGIGLQDLASNFISGITLLFEQSIKVGDFIQIDDLSGVVENISIRSTIIKTIDGVFVIVPNKTFLENKVINWTYKDPKVRIHVPIDVPDESDPLVVAESLLAAARRELDVLPSPCPEVHFKGFREGMDFELLVWINDHQKKDEITSSLYFFIEEELRDRGVDRPIAQRRIYIDNFKQMGSWSQKFTGEELANDSSVSTVLNHEKSQLASQKTTNIPLLRNLLRQVSYFEKCSDTELRHIILRGYKRVLEADEIICRENEPGDCFYIILSGAVEVFVESINKQVATRHPGEFIGEMSLLMGTPRTATLRTLEPTVLFVVDRENLQSLLEKQPDLADKISVELSKRQETLERLGIKIAANAPNETPFTQIRKRIQAIFGI